jgi:hypothetical protein
MGIVLLAALATGTAGLVLATMTLTPLRTRSAAKVGSRSYSSALQRYSIATFRPSE